LLVAASIGVLALSTGVGRAVTGTLSDRLGRRRTLGLAMALGGAAQFGLLAAVHGDYTIAVVLFATLAGAGTGAGYSLLVSMVRDWFGNEATLPNYGVVYTGKAVGSVLGLGLAALAVAAPNSAVAVVVVGLLGLSGAVLTRALRQPGRPVLPLPGT
jgi:MFS family permease